MPTMGAGAVHSIKSAHHAQCFPSAHDRINNLFQLRRHHPTATEYRIVRDLAFTTWRNVTGVSSAVSRHHQPQALCVAVVVKLITPSEMIVLRRPCLLVRLA
jgi:hypothetical protein